jgi:ligand-binding SRPBCC domain-containing protein
MARRLEFEQWVPFRIERVFAFFSNPDNLPNLMPAASRTKLTTIHRTPSPPVLHLATEKAAGVGSTIVTSFRAVPFLPFRANWIARITEFEWNHYFADVQDEGPFRSWHHRHEFIVQERDGVMGTLVRDVIEYEIGFSFVGASVNALFVRHQIEKTFAERQKTLPKLLG